MTLFSIFIINLVLLCLVFLFKVVTNPGFPLQEHTGLLKDEQEGWYKNVHRHCQWLQTEKRSVNMKVSAVAKGFSIIQQKSDVWKEFCCQCHTYFILRTFGLWYYLQFLHSCWGLKKILPFSNRNCARITPWNHAGAPNYETFVTLFNCQT